MTEISKVAAGVSISGFVVGLSLLITGVVQSNGDMLLGGLGSWVVTAAILAVLYNLNRQNALTATSQSKPNRSYTVQTAKPLVPIIIGGRSMNLKINSRLI